MSNDSTKKTILVAVVLCLICSVMVSIATVYLKPQQNLNKKLNVQRNILQIAGFTKNADQLTSQQVQKLFNQFEVKLVNLKTGHFVNATPSQIAEYDQRTASKNPKTSRALSNKEDIASIKRQANIAKIYLVKSKSGQLKTLILPIHGYGLWSTLYGFIALKGDLKTVAGLGFYEQAETPGLGGEVDNPKWKRKWIGKKIYDNDKVAISVIKGTVAADDPKEQYKVDGLAGATLTSNGVTNLIHFWLGREGFKPLIDSIKAGGLS